MDTPVVFLIYRRPELTRRVFQAIAQARPRKLLVVADGPRDETETLRCQETRDIVKLVDWPCEVKTNFAEHNMGLRERISSGLDWVFAQTESAIILEDDCLPHPTFFRYCEALLEYYWNDKQVMHISGDNFGHKRVPDMKDSYYFSQFIHVWGWATWRRAWVKYDVDMTTWPEQKNNVLAKLTHPADRRYWEAQLEATYRRQNQTWAYQWFYTCLLHDGLSALPYENQISNIGISSDGTNTTDTGSPLANLPTEDITFPLKHPTQVKRDLRGERCAANLFWMHKVSLLHRIRFKLMKILRTNQ